MNSALGLKSPALAKAIENYDEMKLRSLAVRAATAALTRANVENPAVDKALAAASQGLYGDEAIKLELTRLADNIEGPYVTALDRAQDVEADPELMELFRKSRAVTALYLALDANIAAQGGNALYEALYAGLSVDDVTALL